MVIFACIITVAGIHGMGQHFADLEPRQFSTAVLYLLCSQFVVSLAIGMAKVVVAVFLLRIINAPWQRWFLWFCIGSMMFLSCFLSVVVFAQCTPVQSIWDPALAEQKVCHISLTVVAFVSCCTFDPPEKSLVDADLSQRMPPRWTLPWRPSPGSPSAG